MTDLERASLLHIVAETPARLKAALKGVPKKLLLWSPGPGKWSILEIVAHMRDMERDAYLTRYRRILAEDNPTLPDLDGDVLAIRDDYRSMKLPELLRDWLKARKECLRLLKSVKGSRWERTGTHETAGPLSMDDLLRRHAMGNDQAHLGQIEGIKKRAAALEALEASSKTLAELTKKLDDGVLRRKSAPEKWSAMEVVCHLRDVEKLWADRIVKAALPTGRSSTRSTSKLWSRGTVTTPRTWAWLSRSSPAFERTAWVCSGPCPRASGSGWGFIPNAARSRSSASRRS
jgi:hypothetical protein